MLEEKLNKFEMIDLLNPKTKLLILLNRLIEDEEPIEKEELIEEIMTCDSALNVAKDYKDSRSARNSIKHHLKQLEKDGIIECFVENSTEYVRLKKKVPALNVIKVDRVFSNNIIVGNIILCMILFTIALFVFDLKLMIFSTLTLLGSIIVWLSYKEKLVI